VRSTQIIAVLVEAVKEVHDIHQESITELKSDISFLRHLLSSCADCLR